VEFAARQAERIAASERAPAATRTKAKFDDQIVAIAAVEARRRSIPMTKTSPSLHEGRFEVVKIHAIRLPPESAQGKLPFEESARHPAALTVVKASRCKATKSRTVIGGLPVSSAMNLSSPEKRPF
jgi:hypothetical protein